MLRLSARCASLARSSLVARAASGAAHVVGAPDSDLNWTLCASGVAPQGAAHGNLKPAELSALVGGESALAAGAAAPAAEAGSAALDWASWDAAQADAQAALEGAPELFMQEGAVGSSRGASLRVRVVTDRADVALLAATLLHRMPARSHGEAPPAITVLAPTTASEGDSGASFVLEGDSATVVLSGPPTLAAFREGVQAAAEAVYAARGGDALLMRCNALQAAPGKTALVFGASDASVGAGLSAGVVYGAHAAVWADGALAAFWGGAVVPGAAAKDAPPTALVAGGAVARALQPDNAVHAPATAVFVGGAAGADAAELAAPFVGDAAEFAARVEAAGVAVKAVKGEGDVMKAL